MLYSLLPGYVWYSNIFLQKITQKSLVELAPLFKMKERWIGRISFPSRKYLFICAGFGGLFGLTQTYSPIVNFQISANKWLAASLIIGNIFLWVSVAWVLGRRIYAHTGLLLAGYEIDVDIYCLDKLRPFTNIALMDVLMIMGALALMPLQALDAQFRWYNYEAGIVIGVLATITVVLFPMWGVHRSIQKKKTERLERIQELEAQTDRDDIPALERILAHKDRILSISTWPLDVRLISRILFYLVIPPIAWIGAAVVENLVESFVGA